MASSDSNAYLQTLTAITSTKSTIFNRQKSEFLAYKEQLLEGDLPVEDEPLKNIRRLVEKMSVFEPPKKDYNDDLDTDTSSTIPKDPRQQFFAQALRKNTTSVDTPADVLFRLKRLLATGELDPAVSGSGEIIAEWQEKLQDILLKEERRMETASLIGKIVEEWVSASKSLQEVKEQGEVTATAETKKEQLDMFTNLVFSPHPVDIDPEAQQKLIKESLDALFQSTPEASAFIKAFRNRFRKLSSKFHNAIDAEDIDYIKTLVGSVASSDIFTNDKRSFLKDHILPSSTILSEILDVLRMWSSDLGSWTWESAGLGGGEGGVKLTPRFHINGKYRIYLDLAPTTALFAHHIGTWYSTHMKHQLKTVFNPDIAAWIGGGARPLDAKFAEKLFECLPDEVPQPLCEDRFSPLATIERRRRRRQRDVFFLNHLPDELTASPVQGYVNAGEGNDDSAAEKKNAGGIQSSMVKEQILHTCIAELHLAKALSTHGGSKTFTIVNSDFKWFGPSLSHETLASVLLYFGFSSEFIEFFRRYLNVPSYFDGETPTPDNIKTRVRGIPLGHPLCDMTAELMLFCLDFLVNKVSGGDVHLYRCFDDIWFWGPDKEKCELVWTEVQKFAETFGLEFNFEKSGSACFTFTEDGSITASEPGNILPRGPIKWGFLTLTSEGKLTPDTKMVEGHITELTRQMSSAKSSSSILAFANAWNRYYATFLPYHFASPCYALGKSHSIMVIKQLAEIQRAVLQNLNRGKPTTLVNFLRDRISTHFPGEFDGAEIPEAWFYWPSKLGGLGLQNPILKLNAEMVWKSNMEDPVDTTTKVEAETFLNRQKTADKLAYRRAKDAWERTVNPVQPTPGLVRRSLIEESEFLTEEEYTSPEARSKFHAAWALVYGKLLEKPADEPELQEVLPGPGEELVEELDVVNTIADWKFIFAMYGSRVLKRWGGLKLVEREWVPAGLLEGARQARGGWEE